MRRPVFAVLLLVLLAACSDGLGGHGLAAGASSDAVATSAASSGGTGGHGGAPFDAGGVGGSGGIATTHTDHDGGEMLVDAGDPWDGCAACKPDAGTIGTGGKGSACTHCNEMLDGG